MKLSLESAPIDCRAVGLLFSTRFIHLLPLVPFGCFINSETSDATCPRAVCKINRTILPTSTTYSFDLIIAFFMCSSFNIRKGLESCFSRWVWMFWSF